MFRPRVDRGLVGVRVTDHVPLTDEHEHIWTAWQPIRDSTAFEPGHSLRACEDCGDRELRGPDGGVLSVRGPGARLVQFAADNPLPADRVPLTDEELTAMEARVNAAEPGPWTTAIFGNSHGYVETELTECSRPLLTHARSDVPRLIADLRTSRADAGRWRGSATKLAQMCRDTAKTLDQVEAENEELEASIVRLQDELSHWAAKHDEAHARALRLEAENRQLREQVEAANSQVVKLSYRVDL